MHCVTTASSGQIFHTYFLVTSIAFGIILVIVYGLFTVKICLLSDSLYVSHNDLSTSSVKANSKQMNSLTCLVVLSVILFSVLPSSLYFYDLIKKKIIFMEAGPVITIGYHLYGCCSFFIYNWRHRDIRKAIIRTAIRCRHCQYNEPLSFKTAIEKSNRNVTTKERKISTMNELTTRKAGCPADYRLPEKLSLGTFSPETRIIYCGTCTERQEILSN
ncbi:hypothetical protein AB6A40_005334 [Gnathostoma spinigerum]|uniref:Uncharacterized protein n=1 Tax=Gnathostoma spinigerum TaxID=75299 RepID=A0ABD6EG99_9BILA